MLSRRRTLLRPAAGPGLPSDTFDRADSTTSLGTSSSGHVWTALEGTWGITGNRAYNVADALNHKAVVVDAGSADVTVEADVTLSAGRASAGLTVRGTDTNNMLFARLRRKNVTPTVDEIDLYKRVAGTYTLIAATSAEGLVLGQTYRLKVVASGSSIQVHRDGVLRLSATITDLATVTRHGLMLYEASEDDDRGSRFDNFAVTP